MTPARGLQTLKFLRCNGDDKIDRRPELDEQEIAELNRRLVEIASRLDEHPQVSVRFFVPGERKHGGKYHTVTGTVKIISSTPRNCDDGGRRSHPDG